jgi:hypothetical protein
MNLSEVRLVLTAAVLHILALSAFGQMAQQYQQAAQAYSNAANQCQVPAASACMRQNATYYGCVANQLSGGPSCGSQPTCSTACGGSSGSSGAGNSGFSPANTGNARNDAIANGVGTAIMLLGKWKMAHDAKKAAQDEAATNETSDEDAGDSTHAAQVAAQAEAGQQRILNEASQILLESNALMASNEVDAGSASPGSSPDSTAAIGALLDSGPAAPDATSAISALLDTPDAANGDAPLNPTAAVSALLDTSDGSQSGAPSSNPHTPQSSSMPTGAGPDIQYENLDHPTTPSTITYGTPQQQTPLYTWSPDNPGSTATYCKGQPNVPCEIDFPGSQGANGTSPAPAPAQLTRPDPVTAPNSSADCDALNQSWSQLIAAASANHQSCLNYYIGQGRTGTGTDSGSLCQFQACQQIHNTWTRSMSDGAAAVASCRQALP